MLSHDYDQPTVPMPYPAPEMALSPACLWEFVISPKAFQTESTQLNHNKCFSFPLCVGFFVDLRDGTASTEVFDWIRKCADLWRWSLANSMIKGIRNESVCGRPPTALKCGDTGIYKEKLKTPPKWAFVGCWNTCEVAFEWSFRNDSCSAKIHRM